VYTLVQHTNHSSVHALICLSGYATTLDNLNNSLIHRDVYIMVLRFIASENVGSKSTHWGQSYVLLPAIINFGKCQLSKFHFVPHFHAEV